MHTDAARHIPRLRRAVLGVALAGTMALAVVGPDDSDVPRVLAAQRAYLGDAYVPPGGAPVGPRREPAGELISIEARSSFAPPDSHGTHAVLFRDGLFLLHANTKDGELLECIATFDRATTTELFDRASDLATAERNPHDRFSFLCGIGSSDLRLADSSGVVRYGATLWSRHEAYAELMKAMRELVPAADFRAFGVLAEACVDSTGFGSRDPWDSDVVEDAR